jgi:hypothetical protein
MSRNFFFGSSARETYKIYNEPGAHGIRKTDRGTNQGHPHWESGHLRPGRRARRESARSTSGRPRPSFLRGRGRSSLASRDQQPRRDIPPPRARLRGTATASPRRGRRGRAGRPGPPRRVPMAGGSRSVPGRRGIPEGARVARSSPSMESGTSFRASVGDAIRLEARFCLEKTRGGQEAVKSSVFHVSRLTSP